MQYLGPKSELLRKSCRFTFINIMKSTFSGPKVLTALTPDVEMLVGGITFSRSEKIKEGNEKSIITSSPPKILMYVRHYLKRCLL